MRRKNKIAVGAAAVLAAAGGGAAIAASQTGSSSEESNAIIDDAAKQLGISPSKLSDALKTALSDRVDAAVAAGRLTKAEETRSRSGSSPTTSRSSAAYIAASGTSPTSTRPRTISV